MTSDGEPLPWYTYPAIDFLGSRPYKDKAVLEFGGGQSTLWWARKANKVVTFEGDHRWFANLKARLPNNVDLMHVAASDATECVSQVETALRAKTLRKVDVIVIDGLYRTQLVPLALRLRSTSGIIICDNAEGYGIFGALKDTKLNRVDFCGYAPGVVLPHVTSIFFSGDSFVFGSHHPICVA